jgi:hypothetical protein
MRSGARVAMGVGAGYLLGRTRKMRLALMIAAAGANGTFGGTPRQLLQQGVKQLSASPELADIGKTVRGELLTATRSAALAAASRRVDAWSDRLQAGGGTPARAAQDVSPEEDETPEEAREEPERPAPRRRKTTSHESRARRGTGTPSGGQQDEAEPAAPRRRATRAGSSTRSSTRTAAQSSTKRAPVRRTRR